MGIFVKKGKVANHSDNCEMPPLRSRHHPPMLPFYERPPLGLMFTSTSIQENAPTSIFGSSYNSNNWIFSFRNKIPETNRDYVRVGAIQSPKKTNMQKIYNYYKKMMDYIIHSKG